MEGLGGPDGSRPSEARQFSARGRRNCLKGAVAAWVCAALLIPAFGRGDDAFSSAPAREDSSATEDAETTGEPESDVSEGTDAGADEERGDLNLLGQTDTSSGESRRNENVQFNLIDNNTLKDLSDRLGTTATLVEEFKVQRGYFGAEYGGSPSSPLHLSPPRISAIHGSLYESHNNSVFDARSFFQVGEVKPARENHYGFTLAAPLWRSAAFWVEGSQQKIRGSVNGNVLVPTLAERTPLTTDPALIPIVERFLGAYPFEAPNRTDIDDRLLNTNSPQVVDTDSATARLDQNWGGNNSLFLQYSFTLQDVKAFQLVAGQNPDTTIRSHEARITWSRVWSPATTAEVSVGFKRVASDLRPEPNAVEPFVSLGRLIESLGPSPTIPIDRAQNRFRYAAQWLHQRGPHQLTAGFELMRFQFNGTETNGHRSNVTFRSDFGRDFLTNLRMGTPTRLRIALGSTHRGFRNWEMQYYLGDEWRISSNLSLNFGLRYEPVTAPVEVNGLSDIPYGCDCNNLAPRFGFAYRLPEGWGVLRAAYGIHYGQIFPVTYGHARFNPPGNIRVVVSQPNLADPLGGRTFEDFNPDDRSSVFALSPDLVAPYSHQYNFSWDLALGDWVELQLGYVGSRSHKLFMLWFTNRAQVVPGIPQTTATVNDRRSDPSHCDIFHLINGSRGYYDAGRVSVALKNWKGLTLNGGYWFSKSMDTGTDYLNTLSSRDARKGRSQSEFGVQQDMKGLSNFDQPHSLLVQFSYDTPKLTTSRPASWLARAFGSWSCSSVVLAKSGTPFSIRSGSDGPGFGNVDGTGGDRPHVIDPGAARPHDWQPGYLPGPSARFGLPVYRPDRAGGQCRPQHLPQGAHRQRQCRPFEELASFLGEEPHLSSRIGEFPEYATVRRAFNPVDFPGLRTDHQHFERRAGLSFSSAIRFLKGTSALNEPGELPGNDLQ